MAEADSCLTKEALVSTAIICAAICREVTDDDNGLLEGGGVSWPLSVSSGTSIGAGLSVSLQYGQRTASGKQRRILSCVLRPGEQYDGMKNLGILKRTSQA